MSFWQIFVVWEVVVLGGRASDMTSSFVVEEDFQEETYMYMHMYMAFMSIHMWSNMCMCIYRYTYTHTHIYIYTYIYICRCVGNVHIHTWYGLAMWFFMACHA